MANETVFMVLNSFAKECGLRLLGNIKLESISPSQGVAKQWSCYQPLLKSFLRSLVSRCCCFHLVLN